MTDEQTEDEPVQVEEAVDEEAEVVEAEAETHTEPEAEAGSDEAEQATVDPEVQEFIGQDTTALHEQPEGDGVIPTEFRTPPGIPAGLDPGTPKERAAD